jgi:hypothetical protein
MVKVPFALGEAGAVGFPQTADRASKWICPACDADVIVKRGPIIVPHFAHKSSVKSCSGGESLAHRATKEWIATNVASPDLTITARCNGCQTTFDAFRGQAGLKGQTEIAIGPYRVDAVATRSDGTVAAAFEVYHTHATGQPKMATLLAATGCNAFEVKAVPDLVAAEYPTAFASVRPLTCTICLKAAAARRKMSAEHTRAMAARAVGRKWKTLTDVAVKKRQRKFTQRWLLLARVSTVASRAKTLHASDEENRFKACATCSKPVELYKWVKCAAAPWGYAKERQSYQHDGHLKGHKNVYHKDCEVPWCTACLERKVPGKWCSCERRKHRKCEDCSKWFLREHMHAFDNPPLYQYPTSWVCKSCAVSCNVCDQKISRQQAKYGGACFDCNRRPKRQRWNDAPQPRSAPPSPTYYHDTNCHRCDESLHEGQCDHCDRWWYW